MRSSEALRHAGWIERLILVALIACKSEDPSPPPQSPPAVPQLPPGAINPRGSSESLATIEKMLPAVEGAKILQTRAPREGFALALWCIDQPDAIERVKAALARDGWSDVRTRGKDDRIGIAATKGEARFSARVAKDPRCAGTFVSATVMKLGKLDLELQDGDRLR